MSHLKFIEFKNSNKQIVREYEVDSNLQWVQYTNGFDHLRYSRSDKHTLSMYLKGGESTFRTDVNAGVGAPGKFCLMPSGAESRWQLAEPQEFVHLYFDDNYLKRLGLELLDLDPRRVNLPELNFHENLKLNALFNYQVMLLDWSEEYRTSIKHQTDSILITLLSSLNLRSNKQIITGGLSPNQLARIHDYINENYQNKILLNELAKEAGLSEFHFCRVFKELTTFSPQSYVTKIRLEKAKIKLAQHNLSLVEVALSCGFSSQSYFGRKFMNAFGISPAKYRRSLNIIDI